MVRSAPQPPVDPRARRVGLALVLAVLASACRFEPPLPPSWPEPARANLDVELRATAAELHQPEPPRLDEEPLTIDEVADVPHVRARLGESAGLTYIEVVLGDVDIDAALPMVLMIHGRGGRPRVPGGPFGCVTTPMRIIMPRAPGRLESGYSWLSVRVAEGRPASLSDELAARADQLAELLADVQARFPTMGRPIVTGFSQGGLLTLALAARHPDLVGLALPLAGWLPPSLWPQSAEGLPVIRSLHGSEDPTIPVPPTRAVFAHLAGLGADVELIEVEGVGHVMTPAMNERFEQWLEQALQEQAPPLAKRPRDTSVELDASGEPSRCQEAPGP